MKNSYWKRTLQFLALALGLTLPSSCWMYSFSGVNLSSDIKTVQVDYFPNDAALINPTLSSYFTNSLQDILLSRTSLRLTRNDGDLVYEGEITRYEQTSVAPMIDASGRAVSNKVRLTITVRVRFYNTKDETQNFPSGGREFTHYADLEGTETLSGSQEQGLVEAIVAALLEDIFNQSVAQW